MRKAVLVLAAAAMWGCDRPTGIQELPRDMTPAALSARADSIHDAALAALPVDDANGITIGVMDEGRTESTNLVSFRTPAEWAVYRFERNAAGWTRGARVEGGRTPAETGMQNVGFSGQVAAIMNGLQIVDQWYVANITTTGTYYQTEGYGPITVNRAVFYPATFTDGDTRYQVTFSEWKAYRDDAPGCDLTFWTANNSDWTPSACRRTDTFAFDNNLKPQRFSLRYQVTVTQLPPFEFAIHDWEANDSEYRAFGIMPQEFGSAVTSVVWQVSSNNINWTTISASNCGMKYAGAFRSGGPATYMRATVTLADGRSRTRTPYYGPTVFVTLGDVYPMC
ncbi:hypothetical protein [Longimicrobium terrae]|uniref:Uncharacterized protein n=1 Tax=Longimicrobium terrae TaxID=1639882 RepID=A0A841GWV1_9BACT|nr:hypothetical protein [Longimicrobium terrae]MBB4635421.1 hypothetical protein [Longimicrobium terrae]MBB6069815.1 hypothetical protein [Longimicrobium terrae]NNC30977.1 hypothetical protein [Longimicrobium terrae]NNC32737.1 hypothetical protein [Longimicrobium terrae]